MKEQLCNCGSGEIRRELADARRIFIAYVCDICIEEKIKGYRPDIFTDSNYPTSEQIEED
tara:strand:- start:4779 stop:4958 length:180 start_codon:yes stop_codon:yes gene_type:complete